MAERRQKSRQPQFPITVRQAQKLAHRGNVKLSAIAHSIGVEPDRYLLLSELARLAAKDPNQLIYVYEAGANPPSDAQLLPEEQGQEGEQEDSQDVNISQPQGEGSGTPQTDSGTGEIESPRSEYGCQDGNTSEGGSAPENSRNAAHQLDNSPSTALGENDRVGGTQEANQDVQLRDAGAQEGSDSPSTVVPNAPEDNSGEGDRAGETSTQPIETGSDGRDGGNTEKPADDRPAHQKKWGKKFSRKEKAGAGQLSATGKDSHGGVTAQLDQAGIDRTLVQLCRARLEALVGDNSQKTSPRRDYAEFCTRLKTYRNPAPARKEEEGRAVILLMADVSGSCSAFSGEAVKVAKAASRLGVAGADVLIISHSNGSPEQMELNGKPIDVSTIGDADMLLQIPPSQWYDRLLSRYPIEVVVALGDWDAVDVYKFLVHQPGISRFIWLDHANRGLGVRDCTPMALMQFQTKGIRHKLVYRQGCQDAREFIQQIK